MNAIGIKLNWIGFAFAAVWSLGSVLSAQGDMETLILILVASGFWLSGARALYRVRNAPARIYAWVCIGICLALCPAPSFAHTSLNHGLALIRATLIFLAWGGVWHLAWLLPWGAKRPPQPVLQLIYGLPAMALFIVVVRVLWLSESGEVFNNVMLVFISVFLAAGMLSASIMFLRKFVRSNSQQRREKGTALMLAGTLLALVSVLLVVSTPLNNVSWAPLFYLLAWLVPLSWGRVVRHMDSGTS